MVDPPWGVDLGTESDIFEERRTAATIAKRSTRPSARSVAPAPTSSIETILLRGRRSEPDRGARRVRCRPTWWSSAIAVMGRWESMLLGSVSAEVVDHAPCPVLVARDERLGPVILADDGSAHARRRGGSDRLADVRRVAGHGRDAWTRTASRIRPRSPPLIYAETMDAYATATAAQRSATEADCEAPRRRGCVRPGSRPVPRCAKAIPPTRSSLSARQHGAGLVVVGTRGQTGLRRLILGSVARNVLLHAPCSVLVVRGGPRV